MKCPLMLTYDVSEAPCEHPSPMDCLKEKCAWWEKEGEGCAALLIGLRLGTICDELSGSVAKMPHER